MLYRLMLVGATALALMAGCGRVALPPSANVVEIVPSGRAAKPPGCSMPVLRYPPPQNYREVAMIAGQGNVYASESDVLPIVIQKACETGADAIIVEESRSQTTENYVGYYINAAAIVYPKPGESFEQKR